MKFGFILIYFLFFASSEDSRRKAPAHGEEISDLDVQCTSTKGTFTIEMHPEWAPIGGQRFLDLIRDGAFDGTVIYRVVRSRRDGGPEAVQFGFIKDEEKRRKWKKAPNLKDDPQIFSNPNFHRGMISFAGGGPNTRSTDVFITFMTGNANGTPRAPWETPFGIIDEEGLKVIAEFGGTGDLKHLGGNAPNLGLGYEALKESHPDIDYLGKCVIIEKNAPILEDVINPSFSCKSTACVTTVWFLCTSSLSACIYFVARRILLGGDNKLE